AVDAGRQRHPRDQLPARRARLHALHQLLRVRVAAFRHQHGAHRPGGGGQSAGPDVLPGAAHRGAAAGVPVRGRAAGFGADRADQEHHGDRGHRRYRSRRADGRHDRAGKRQGAAGVRHLRGRLRDPDPADGHVPRLGRQEGECEAMSRQASVLYDAPGPRAKQRNAMYTVRFVAALALAAWWFISELDARSQLEAESWTPLLEAGVWTDFFIPGLLNTLQAAFLSILIALPIGALLGIARLSEHAWIRWPAAVWVEFFRATPVLILMLFSRELYRMAGVDSEILPLYAVVTGLV